MSRCSLTASDLWQSFQQSLHRFGPSNSQKCRQVEFGRRSWSLRSHWILLREYPRELGTRLKIFLVYFNNPGSIWGSFSDFFVSLWNRGWWNIHSGSKTGSFKVITRNSAEDVGAWTPRSCFSSCTRGLRTVTIFQGFSFSIVFNDFLTSLGFNPRVFLKYFKATCL